MISVDEITCRIPTEAAIKVQELSCSVAEPVASADSQTWATWVGAIATVFAVVAAGLAWLEARSANEAASRNLSIQLKEQKALTLHQMEMEKLARFSEAMVWFANNVLIQDTECIADLESNDHAREIRAREIAEQNLEDRCRELVSQWMTWAMFLIATDDEFREATNSILTHTQNQAREILGMQVDSSIEFGQGRGLSSQLQRTIYLEKLDTLITNTGSAIANIQFIRQEGEGWQNLRRYLIETFPKI